MAEAARVAEFWDRVELSRTKQFWDLPVVRRYRNRLVSGDETTGSLQWFKEKYVDQPFENGLSLGCGSGHLERLAIKLGIAKQLTGIDIAPGRLLKAQTLAQGLPVKYKLQDINVISLEKNRYDFVLCKTIFHHIRNLEHLFSELWNCMKPEGLIYVDEYIGPSRFQFSEKVLRIGDRILNEIPVSLRLTLQDRIKTAINRIDPAIIIGADPSEAVRSSEIDPLIKQHFTVLEEKGSGGGVLFRLLDGIAQNFDHENTGHNQILNALCNLEEKLTGNGIIADIFKVYVLKK